MNIILTGSSGSGLLSAGDIVMEGLQNAGYFIVADREYPSLIKGGCSYFRIEVGVNPIHSISEFADIIVAFDRVGSKNALPHVRHGGLIIYGDEMHGAISGYDRTIAQKKLTTIFIPEYSTPKKFGANELLSNMLMIGALWRALGLPVDGLIKAVEKRFASKPTLLALDIALINHGYNLNDAVIQEGQKTKDKRQKEGIISVIPEFGNASETAGEISGIQANNLSQGELNNEGNNDLDSVLQRNDGNTGMDSTLHGESATSRSQAHLTGMADFHLPTTTNNLGDHKLLDGNEILALSAVHHGVRAYFAYPMSPSSTILSHLANWADKTGMHVEQVEDEISVSQMTLGASFAGTRSLCATSGGGFDLMTETVSLAGMIETPLTVIVAQRPGPATGLPTWSGQEDLNLAIYSGHGEYAKAVIAVGDHAEAFTVLGEALNIAETFQIPVIVLTDKNLAETNATVNPASLVGVEIERGLTIPSSSGRNNAGMASGVALNTNGVKAERHEGDPGIQADELREANNKNGLDTRIKSEYDGKLNSTDRYKLTKSGISPRWLPGTGPRYYANGDEHGPDGTLREDAAGVAEAHEKRIRKIKTLEAATPEPILLGNPDAKITLVGFGSTKMEVMDFIESQNNCCCSSSSGESVHCVAGTNEDPGIQVNKLSQSETIKSGMDSTSRSQAHLAGMTGKVNYLHYTHLWPLKTETIKKLSKKNKIIVVEHNMTGQFANLLKAEDVRIDDNWLKYDGRRFYREEMEAKIALASGTKRTILGDMKKKYASILILALIALGNAIYLSWTAHQLLSGKDVSSGCDINPTFSCSNVIIHPDTMIAGIPFPYLALLVYPIITLLTIWGIMSMKAKPARIINWIALAGICFNGYIISQEVLFVHAYCLLCLICAAIIVTIFGVSWTMRR